MSTVLVWCCEWALWWDRLLRAVYKYWVMSLSSKDVVGLWWSALSHDDFGVDCGCVGILVKGIVSRMSFAPTHPSGAGVSSGRVAVRDASAIPCRGALGVRAERGVGTFRRYHPGRCLAGTKASTVWQFVFSALVIFSQLPVGGGGGGSGSDPRGAVSHLAQISLSVVIWFGHNEHLTARSDTPCNVLCSSPPGCQGRTRVGQWGPQALWGPVGWAILAQAISCLFGCVRNWFQYDVQCHARGGPRSRGVRPKSEKWAQPVSRSSARSVESSKTRKMVSAISSRVNPESSMQEARQRVSQLEAALAAFGETKSLKVTMLQDSQVDPVCSSGTSSGCSVCNNLLSLFRSSWILWPGTSQIGGHDCRGCESKFLRNLKSRLQQSQHH